MKRIPLALHILVMAALILIGCRGVDDIRRDPLGAAQSAVRVGKAAVTASQDITEEQEIYLGRSVSARILSKYPLYNDPNLNKYINLVGTTVAMTSDRPDLAYHFAVLDSNEVNAFAAPGGYIFITRGMVRGLSGEDDLAAILGHEIGHVCAKHALKSIKGDLWKKVVMVAAQETAKHQGVNPELLSLFGQATDNVLGTLMNVGYSQPMELEADQLGQTYAARAGYNPASLNNYLRLMADREKKKDSSLKTILGTHPSYSDRLGKLPQAGGQVPSQAAIELRRARYRVAVR